MNEPQPEHFLLPNGLEFYGFLLEHTGDTLKMPFKVNDWDPVRNNIAVYFDEYYFVKEKDGYLGYFPLELRAEYIRTTIEQSRV